MLITPSTRAPRRLFAMLASALALAIGFSGIAATTSLDSAAAAGANPLAPLNGFTVVTQGDATFGNSGEIEGSLSVGGDLRFDQYNLAPNQDGSALPTVDGVNNVGLFVGGTVKFPGNGSFVINGAGIARITGTSALNVSADNRLYKGGNQQAYVKSQAGTQTTLASYTATPGAYAAAFPASTFSTLASTSAAYAGITSTGGDYAVVGALGNPNGEPIITLVSGKTNIWNVSSAALVGKTAFQFANGVTPSASTPLIINVTDASSGTLNAVRVGDKTTAPYVLWNFSAWTALEITGSAQLNGSILAPSAALKNSNGSETNGQIVAKSFVSNTGAEIHHYGFSFTPPEKKTVAGSWSSTTECATPSNQLVVAAVTGVSYTWTAGGTGTFTSFSQTGLTGTYAFTVSVTDANQYTLGKNATSFSVTFASPKDCNPPTTECIPPKLVNYTYTAATNSGTVTVPNPAGYNGLLCKPFWVTAVAWKYTTSATWPQALDVENAMSNNEGGVQITKAGTYTYGAPVGCGQGDIYASFANQKQTSPTLNGVSMLTAPQTPFTEHFLHEMGFNGPNPTYTQSPNGCNKATPVAPSATPITACETYGSVTVGSGKDAVALTATAPTATIGGVVYTLTAGNGTAGTWQVTATPAQNRFFDGPQSVVYSGDLKTRTNCTAAVEPKVEIAVCDSATGTISSAYLIIPSTAGLIYSVDGNAYEAGDKVALTTGSHTVTVATKPGYTNTGKSEFPLTVNAYPGGCLPPTNVSGAASATPQTCDTSYVLQSGGVLAVVKTGVRYELWNQAQDAFIADLTAGTSRPTANGSYYVKVVPLDSTFKVLPADMWIPVTLSPYAGTCEAPTAVSGSATASAETCSATDYISNDAAAYTVGLGSVTANAAAGVTYELWNQAKTTRVAVLTADQAFKVAGGSYFVRVLPLSAAYTVAPADEWIAVDVAKNAKVCEVLGDPTMFQQCVINPLDTDTSDWTAYLTIVAADHVKYEVFFSNGTTWVSQGIWAAGRYDAGTAKLPYDTLVEVRAVADADWSLLEPTTWTFDFSPASVCDLPTGGTVTPTVTFAQTCTAGASYTLAIEGGVQGTVLWSVNGGPETTQLGTFSTSAPSKLVIVARPAPGSGFDNGTTPVRTFEKTFTDPASCDLTTLALTGQETTGYLLVAIILFQAGLALVAVQFVRARRKARHLAS